MARFGSFGSGLAGGYLEQSALNQKRDEAEATATYRQDTLAAQKLNNQITLTKEALKENGEAIQRAQAFLLQNPDHQSAKGVIDGLVQQRKILFNQYEQMGGPGGGDVAAQVPAGVVEDRQLMSPGQVQVGAVSGDKGTQIDPAPQAQTVLEKLQSYRAKLVAANPDDPQIAAVDDAIEKETTFKPAAGDALAIQQLQDYRATLPEGDDRIPAVDAAIEKLTTHKPTAPKSTVQFVATDDSPEGAPKYLQLDPTDPVAMKRAQDENYVRMSVVQQTTAKVPGGYETRALRDAARTQTDLFDLGESMLNDLIDHLKADPSAGGLEGAFRRIAQKVSRGLGSLSPRADVPFADNVREWIDRSVEANELDATAAMEIRAEYLDDPKLSEIEVLENSLAMIYARVLNPKDRLLKDQLDIARQMVKVVGFGPGNWDVRGVVEKLSRVRADLVSRRSAIEKRLGETSTATTTATPTPTSPTTLNFDSDGNPID